MAANTTGTQTTRKSSWFDEAAHTPLISQQAQRLDPFVAAMADGKITDNELKSQEERVIELMKEIEPQLEPKLHARLTELLCELTAYGIMQMFHMMQDSRPASKFRG